MDYGIFKLQLKKAYKQADCNFSFEDALSIFMNYFQTFEAFMRYRHKPMKTQTLISILDDLDGDGQFDVEDYPPMIEAYFWTYFENCDRCISHFMSGEIRRKRFYEVCY